VRRRRIPQAGGFYGPEPDDHEGNAMMFAANSGHIAGTEAERSWQQ
jgi:hypothetical protein